MRSLLKISGVNLTNQNGQRYQRKQIILYFFPMKKAKDAHFVAILVEY